MRIERPSFYSSPDNGFRNPPLGEPLVQVSLGLDYRPTVVAAFNELTSEPNSTLTLALAGEVYKVSHAFGDEVLIASLIAHSEGKRKKIFADLSRILKEKDEARGYDFVLEDPERLKAAEKRYREVEARIEAVRLLPQAPQSWQDFMNEISTTQKKVLMDCLGSTLFDGNRFHAWKGLESTKAIGNLRAIEIPNELMPDSKVPRSDIFLSLAFRGPIQPQTT